MEQIRTGNKEDLASENMVLDDLQSNEILLGLTAGLDVSVYADPRYSSQQMEQIRLGLEAGIDVSAMLDSNLSWEEMKRIRMKV